MADRVVVDGSGWSGDGLAALRRWPRCRSDCAVEIADFALVRQSRWREAIASTFDNPDLLPFARPPRPDQRDVRASTTRRRPGRRTSSGRSTTSPGSPRGWAWPSKQPPGADDGPPARTGGGETPRDSARRVAAAQSPRSRCVVRPMHSELPSGTTLRVELDALAQRHGAPGRHHRRAGGVHARVWRDGERILERGSTLRGETTSTSSPRRSRRAGATRSRSRRWRWPPSSLGRSPNERRTSRRPARSRVLCAGGRGADRVDARRCGRQLATSPTGPRRAARRRARPTGTWRSRRCATSCHGSTSTSGGATSGSFRPTIRSRTPISRHRTCSRSGRRAASPGPAHPGWTRPPGERPARRSTPANVHPIPVGAAIGEAEGPDWAAQRYAGELGRGRRGVHRRRFPHSTSCCVGIGPGRPRPERLPGLGRVRRTRARVWACPPRRTSSRTLRGSRSIHGSSRPPVGDPRRPRRRQGRRPRRRPRSRARRAAMAGPARPSRGRDLVPGRGCGSPKSARDRGASPCRLASTARRSRCSRRARARPSSSSMARPPITRRGAGPGRASRRRYRVHAIDRRGRGDSGDGDGPYTIEREFEDLAAVADALADETGEPVNVVGHSYGGRTGLGRGLADVQHRAARRLRGRAGALGLATASQRRM